MENGWEEGINFDMELRYQTVINSRVNGLDACSFCHTPIARVDIAHIDSQYNQQVDRFLNLSGTLTWLSTFLITKTHPGYYIPFSVNARSMLNDELQLITVRLDYLTFYLICINGK